MTNDDEVENRRLSSFLLAVYSSHWLKLQYSDWREYIFQPMRVPIFTGHTEVMLESLTLASVNEVILWLGENPCKAEKKKKKTKWNTSRNTSRNMMCFSSSFQLYKGFLLITTQNPATEVTLERSLTLASVNEAILWLGENPWKAEKKKKSLSCFY